MKPDEFVKSFDFIVEAAMTWADCLKEPFHYRTLSCLLNANMECNRNGTIFVKKML